MAKAGQLVDQTLTLELGWRQEDTHFPGEHEVLRASIYDLFERGDLVLHRFGFEEQRQRLKKLLEDNAKDLLWEIQEPPTREGDIYVLAEFKDLLRNLTFAWGRGAGADQTATGHYLNLLQILRNVEKMYTKGRRRLPQNEADFHNDVESVLVCSFPRLKRTPAISNPVKNFQPDTGIPETKTLIEYKYLDKPEKVSQVADEILADISGYESREWTNLVFVIYETQRFETEENWRAQIKAHERRALVLVKGASAATPAPTGRRSSRRGG